MKDFASYTQEEKTKLVRDSGYDIREVDVPSRIGSASVISKQVYAYRDDKRYTIDIAFDIVVKAILAGEQGEIIEKYFLTYAKDKPGGSIHGSLIINNTITDDKLFETYVLASGGADDRVAVFIDDRTIGGEQSLTFGANLLNLIGQIRIQHDSIPVIYQETGVHTCYLRTKVDGGFNYRLEWCTDNDGLFTPYSTAFRFVKDAGLYLYHNNVVRFETTTTGAKVTGTFHITAPTNVVKTNVLYYDSASKEVTYAAFAHALATSGPHTGELPLADLAAGTAGDIITRQAADWAVLAKGTEGYVLKMGATYPAWAVPIPAAHDLVNSYHTASGLTTGHTVRATGATSFAWAQLQHSDLGGVTANLHHSETLTRTKGSYVWDVTDEGRTYDHGVTLSFVSATEGWFNYGTVTTFKGYSVAQDGAVMQIYTPYSPGLGGSFAKIRFGKYDNAGWSDWQVLGSAAGISFGLDNQVPYTNSTTDDFDYSVNLTFDGTKLGIGIASPAQLLHLDSASTVIQFDHSTTNFGYIGRAATIITGGGSDELGIRSATDILFSSGLSEKMRITAAGKVGIGETNPTSRLDVKDNTTGVYAVDMFQDHASGHGIRMEIDGVTSSQIVAKFGTTVTAILTVRADSRVGILNTSPSYNLDVNGTGRFTGVLTLDSSLCLGTSDQIKFGAANEGRIYHNATDFYIRSYKHGGRIMLQGENASGVNKALIYADPDDAVQLYRAGSLRFHTTSTGVYVTGTSTASDFILSSDIRFKENIKTLSGLNIALQLNPVTYTRKDNKETNHVGFIAQEVEKVNKNLVREDDKGYKGISYSRITAINNAAIHELHKRIKKLETKIKNLN